MRGGYNILTHVKSVAEKLVVEELVDDDDLGDDDQEVGGLAGVEQGCVPVVLVVKMLLRSTQLGHDSIVIMVKVRICHKFTDMGACLLRQRERDSQRTGLKVVSNYPCLLRVSYHQHN